MYDIDTAQLQVQQVLIRLGADKGLVGIKRRCKMQYQGGKSRIAGAIAAKIRELHSTATEIWEPFCGGGAGIATHGLPGVSS